MKTQLPPTFQEVQCSFRLQCHEVDLESEISHWMTWLEMFCNKLRSSSGMCSAKHNSRPGYERLDTFYTPGLKDTKPPACLTAFKFLPVSFYYAIPR